MELDDEVVCERVRFAGDVRRVLYGERQVGAAHWVELDALGGDVAQPLVAAARVQYSQVQHRGDS